ncbi:MAG: transglutaminase-like domain-containing protein [Proteobacteria bacterium]|nr:transglutaminase-like domain-containing protein [Pseudomonadota bacterium]MBU4295245.1 transglutaminase-like domain-containing protein [Pseudomonadota bacterium]MCG2750179.1 transglutaminase-like domain-containing protein [Desulfobulbaceae bacterium]
MFRKRLVTAGKFLVILVWAALFVALLQRDYFVKRLDLHENEVLEKAGQESYAGVFFKGERIGYVKNVLRRADDGLIRLSQDAVLNLFVLQKNYPVQLQAEAWLSTDFLLRDFTFSMSSPFYTMKASGKVTGKRVDFTLVTGKEKINDSVTLNSPPFLSLNQRGYLLRQGLHSGDKIRIAYFDPFTLSGKDTVIEYKGLLKTLIKDRIYLLHHFEENFSGIRINSWLDDSGKVIKEESPAGFVFLSEPEFQAKDITRKGQDILQSVAVPFSGDLSHLDQREEIFFRLELPEAAGFDLDGGRQQWQDGILTIRREKMPVDDAMICQGMQDELAATPYIQSDHANIKAQAGKITAQIASPIGRVKAIAHWVYENLEKRPVIGIPDAVATLERGMGDCNEHAVLFAALVRSAGIPARIASGVTFHAGAFYYHAWNEVCVGNEWLSFDTTTGQLPADLSHIRFVIGETKEQVKIGALLGNLQILPVK